MLQYTEIKIFFFHPSLVQASSKGLQRLYCHVLLCFYLFKIDMKQSKAQQESCW